MGNGVLIIEDEATLAKNVQRYLERHGFEVSVAESGEQGLEELERLRPDAVLLDFQLGGMNGLEVLEHIRSRDRQVKVIMVTGQGNVQLAVDAMKAGAYDYVAKPVVLGELRMLLDKALGQERMEEALSYYHQREAIGSGIDKIQGESAPMKRLKDMLRQILAAEAQLTDNEPPAVLVTGETGTGKELVARALHFDGPRAGKPFFEVNCASIPANLLEAELFGYERGAFTDAKERKLGLVEAADGGTLFLDEIGDVDLQVQVKLLKLLEEKSVRRLGSLRDSRVNVRIVTATNRPLEQMVKDGRFRSDLYFRLRIIEIQLPPLRERGKDILLLARHFLSLHAVRYGKKNLRFSPEAEQVLMSYEWPGNVRELRNAMEQTVLLARSEMIQPEHFAFCPALATPGLSRCTGASFCLAIPDQGVDLEQVERELVVQALERSGGNITQAAKLLGLSRDAMRYRVEKFALKAAT